MTSKQNDRKLLREIGKAKQIFLGFQVFKSLLVKMSVMHDFKTG